MVRSRTVLIRARISERLVRELLQDKGKLRVPVLTPEKWLKAGGG